MSKVSPLVDGLINAFQCLPGVGPKSAQRMVLHLLERNKDAGLILAQLLEEALESVDKCNSCRIFTESDSCQICSNEKRNKNQICVVESVSDVFAIEQSNQFNGHYFVLHGYLSPIDDIGPEELALDVLFSRARQIETEELILATNSTLEGETTSHFIYDNLKNETHLKITKLARGVPLGGELEYVDRGTIMHALSGRQRLKEEGE
ncbi:recombination mediator RecR [Gammaproteobacteria bacterium]|jgi:recombination protein RecR|nr:recombination protein RecR [Gammaproteobacteria bacterium]MDA9736132.1 recombination mediator RecR [Gammaproteobacteria bacterium]MEC8314252.1 recombination mediator RecR [Pseudomonadota bacterium]MED5349798.1 recombination mediator RecR [Pseudomonadota bacterium]GIR86819.1 MAG: recombination protein RecR [Gammaproteobacteria bacterium]|tara:strand:- start:183 stop:800 length:618 start_codon:yes stop_codon:yes gene_type:complete